MIQYTYVNSGTEVYVFSNVPIGIFFPCLCCCVFVTHTDTLLTLLIDYIGTALYGIINSFVGKAKRKSKHYSTYSEKCKWFVSCMQLCMEWINNVLSVSYRS